MSDKVVIIGGGPAGFSAAVELAKNGLKSIIIDEAPKLGGVIYRGPLRNVKSAPNIDSKLQKSIENIQEQYRLYLPFITFMANTKVLGPEGDNSLLTIKNTKLSVVDYDHLIIATGCHERSVPFPGWTMSGVMLLGGIQLQLKSGLVKPGQKVVLTGSGPLLFLVACQLHKAGCTVITVCEAETFSTLSQGILSMLNRPLQLLNGLSMLLYLKKNKIPIKYGWGILRADGVNSEINTVTIAPYDGNWLPDTRGSVILPADTLGVGYGFVARSQLAQLLGVSVNYNNIYGVVPQIDKWQMGSVDDIYFAGDTAKLAGADAASIEGIIAATSIVYKCGKKSLRETEKKISRLHKILSRHYNFRKPFDNSELHKSALIDLAEPDTIICRCENVRREEIDRAIKEGCRDIVTLKMRTRITMGDCQGKVCSSYCYDRFKRENIEVNDILINPRFPLDLIPFSALKDGL